MANKIFILFMIVGCNRPMLKKVDPLSYHT